MQSYVWNLTIIERTFASMRMLESQVVHKCAHLLDIEKCCKTNIWLQNKTSIQPRTSPPKFGNGWQHLTKLYQIWRLGKNIWPSNAEVDVPVESICPPARLLLPLHIPAQCKCDSNCDTNAFEVCEKLDFNVGVQNACSLVE